MFPKLGRAPYGARGLKFSVQGYADIMEVSRAPYGARGLKFALQQLSQNSFMVAPRMGRVD